MAVPKLNRPLTKINNHLLVFVRMSYEKQRRKKLLK